MEPFNNFERWTKLKTHIESNRELYQLLQDFWQVYSQPNNTKNTSPSLDAKIKFLNDGRNRDVYRIGKTTEYEIDCGFGKIVLACKVPGVSEHRHFTYDTNYFHPEPQDWTEYYISQENLNLRPLREAQFFEEAGLKGGVEDKSIPCVTGIIAGYGIIGTITEDVTRGGRREVLGGDWENLRVREGNIEEEILIDGKHHFSLDCDTDYYFHRLQIDNPFSKK